MKITHLTSAHPRYDTRIFIKMCSSLAKIKNYKVSLVVADGKGDEIKNGVEINNSPILGKLSNETAWCEKKDEVCYVGGIVKMIEWCLQKCEVK